MLSSHLGDKYKSVTSLYYKLSSVVAIILGEKEIFLTVLNRSDSERISEAPTAWNG